MLGLPAVDVLALMEPGAETRGTATPVAITVRDEDYELTVVSQVAGITPSSGACLLPRARLVQ